MKAIYDSDVDVHSDLFRDTRIQQRKEGKPGVIREYDAAGNDVGAEILTISQRVDNPRSMDIALKK